MKVYFGRPFTGQPYEEVIKYYQHIENICSDNIIKPIIPITMSENLMDGIIKDDISHLNNPTLTDRGIVYRDKWMLLRSDVLVMDLTFEVELPVGVFFELAWAKDHGLHTVTLFEKGSKFDRVFIRESSDIILTNIDNAIEYLSSLS